MTATIPLTGMAEDERGEGDAGPDAAADGPGQAEELASPPDAELGAAQTPPIPPTAAVQSSAPPPPEISFRGTATNASEYVGYNGDDNEYLYGSDDNFWTFHNSLYLQANSRPFDGAVRLDATLFHDPPRQVYRDDFFWGPGSSHYTTLNYHNDYRVERIWGTVKSGNVRVTAGDFYVTFGRGMVLSLVKLDDFNLDNSLRGARFDYQLRGRFKVTAVGGVVNMLNIDPVTHQILEDDPLDRIVGARLEWQALKELEVGAHAVYMWPRFTEESDIAPERMFVDRGAGIRAVNAGLTTDIALNDVHVYLEGNGQVHDNYRPPEGAPDIKGEPGWAAFAEIAYDASPFSVKTQGFYYRKWLMEGPLRGSAPDITATVPALYSTRVSLEPTWVPQKSFGNSWGGKVTGDLYMDRSETQLTLDNAVIVYNGGLVPLGAWIESDDTVIVHPILTVRQDAGDTGIRVTAGGGHLWELELQDEQRVGTLWHVLIDTAVPITGPHGISVHGELRRHSLHVSEGGFPYWVVLVKGGYDWSGLFGLSAIYEYSDQTAGIDAKIGDWLLPLQRQHYLKATAYLHPPAPLDGFTFTLSGGSQRGGRKCTGGGCRDYPNSVGAMLETVYQF